MRIREILNDQWEVVLLMKGAALLVVGEAIKKTALSLFAIRSLVRLFIRFLTYLLTY